MHMLAGASSSAGVSRKRWDSLLPSRSGIHGKEFESSNLLFAPCLLHCLATKVDTLVDRHNPDRDANTGIAIFKVTITVTARILNECVSIL